MHQPPKSKTATDLFYKHISFLPHPAGIVRLMQFAHDSPGLRKYKLQVAEALVLLLEDNGMLIFDSEADVIAHVNQESQTAVI